MIHSVSFVVHEPPRYALRMPQNTLHLPPVRNETKVVGVVNYDYTH